MSAAGEVVNIREIQIFTQKGLYARRIMDQMGLADLNQKSLICDSPSSAARRGAKGRAIFA